jgi:hypothetical protein
LNKPDSSVTVSEPEKQSLMKEEDDFPGDIAASTGNGVRDGVGFSEGGREVPDGWPVGREEGLPVGFMVGLKVGLEVGFKVVGGR